METRNMLYKLDEIEVFLYQPFTTPRPEDAGRFADFEHYVFLTTNIFKYTYITHVHYSGPL